MSKSASIPTRIEPEEEAKSIFEKIGIALSSAVSFFYPKTHSRLASHPDNEIPNKQTSRAMKDIKLGRNLKEYKDAHEMIEDNIPNRATRKVIRDTRKGKNLIAFENEEEVFK